VNLVLLVVVALAGVAIADNRQTITDNKTAIANIRETMQHREIRLILLEDHYGIVLDRLDSIDQTLIELNGRVRRPANRTVRTGHSTTNSGHMTTSRRPSNEDVLNGLPAAEE
jgi:hypothetical protein